MLKTDINNLDQVIETELVKTGKDGEVFEVIKRKYKKTDNEQDKVGEVIYKGQYAKDYIEQEEGE